MNSQNSRLYYIDWLRLLAFGLLFLFHAWRPFDHFEWNIKNSEQSTFFDFLTIFFHGWRMDLIFLVSGVGTWYALNSRKSDFLKDRFLRLIVPFIAGIVLVVPPQKFIEGISFHGFKGNYLDFFQAWPPYALSFNFHSSVLMWYGHLGAHIYYLPFLFTMTLFFLPVYKLLKGIKISERIHKLLITQTGVFLLIVPLIIIRFCLKPLYPAYTDWADFFSYMCMFAYGFVFVKNQQFMKSIKVNMWVFLNIGIVGSVILIYLLNHGDTSMQMYINPHYSIQHFYITLVSVMVSFGWVLFILALASKKLNFNHQILKKSNAAILPVYILHQTIIIVFGYYILRWDQPIIVKFVAISCTSIPFTIAMYLVIKRVNTLRILFGMKPKIKNLQLVVSA